MIVTPEVVRVEMEYRLEQALAGDALDHLREARRQHPSWWRRVAGHLVHRAPSPVNQVRTAA